MMRSPDYELLRTLDNADYPFDAIVVEGYEGVGKGRILSLLSEHYNVVPYRPDYNLWQFYNLKAEDRWKISGFFWDIYSHFNHHSGIPMLFDRGCISGSVYNNDPSIALSYKELLRGMRVMHILVCCSKEDFVKFLGIRFAGKSIECDIEEEWSRYEKYTLEYIKRFNDAKLDYIIYYNNYDEREAKRLSETCAGCGHYSYGYCRHPSFNCRVDKDKRRCGYSCEKEVQDQDVSEMQCL